MFPAESTGLGIWLWSGGNRKNMGMNPRFLPRALQKLNTLLAEWPLKCRVCHKTCVRVGGWAAQKQVTEFLMETSLVAQWLRIRLPMQGTWVWALIREDPTCRRAAKPMRHNYWTCSLEPVSHNCWAHMPQLLKPACLEPVLRNKRSHLNEKPTHRNEE